MGLAVEDVAATVDEWHERLQAGGMLIGTSTFFFSHIVVVNNVQVLHSSMCDDVT